MCGYKGYQISVYLLATIGVRGRGKTMEIRANARKNQENAGRCIRKYVKIRLFHYNRSFSSDVTAAILVYQNNEMAAILVYVPGISSFLFKYFVLFHHPTGATDHVSENDLFSIKIRANFQLPSPPGKQLAKAVCGYKDTRFQYIYF